MSDTEVQPAPEAGAGNDDVRAAVVAAYEQHHPDTDVGPDNGPEIAAAPAEDVPTTDRPRNERGQFIKADGTVDETVTQPEAETVPDADPAADKPEPASTPIEPPTSWSAEAKAEWSKLSPAVQQAVFKRDMEINEGGRRWSEEKRAVETMLDPIRQQAARTGLSFDEGFKRLVDMSTWMERDPHSAIRALAQSYGVNLAQTPTEAPQAQQPAAVPRADPVVQQLQTELVSLKDMIEQQQKAEAQSSIETFAKAQGHEHFETVKGTMGQLIASGQAADLQDAYDKAVWLDPNIRSSLIAAQTASAEAERRARETAAADKARRGAISLSGSPAGAGVPVNKPEYATVEEATRAAWAQYAN